MINFDNRGMSLDAIVTRTHLTPKQVACFLERRHQELKMKDTLRQTSRGYRKAFNQAVANSRAALEPRK